MIADTNPRKALKALQNFNTLQEASTLKTSLPTRCNPDEDDTSCLEEASTKTVNATEAPVPPEDPGGIKKHSPRADSVVEAGSRPCSQSEGTFSPHTNGQSSPSSLLFTKNDSAPFPGTSRPLTGTYISTITAPGKAGDLFGPSRFGLTVTNNTPRGAWWAVFSHSKPSKPDRSGREVLIPVCDGIIRVEKGPRLALDLDSPFSLTWKLRDLRDNMVHSGVGMIIFRKRGDVFVQLFEVPTAEAPVVFTGIRNSELGIRMDLQHTWDGFADKGPQK